MKWFELEVFGMQASYLNHYLWLRPIIEPMKHHRHPFPEFPASAGLLLLYWAVFRASDLLLVQDRLRIDYRDLMVDPGAATFCAELSVVRWPQAHDVEAKIATGTTALQMKRKPIRRLMWTPPVGQLVPVSIGGGLRTCQVFAWKTNSSAPKWCT